MSGPDPQPSPPVVPAQGLGEAEVAQRLARDGANLMPEARPKSLAAIELGVLAEPMLLMLLVAGCWRGVSRAR